MTNRDLISLQLASLRHRIGRKKTILMLVVVGATGNFLGIFLTDLITYTVLRFFTGIGAYTVCTTVFVVGKHAKKKKKKKPQATV